MSVPVASGSSLENDSQSWKLSKDICLLRFQINEREAKRMVYELVDEKEKNGLEVQMRRRASKQKRPFRQFCEKRRRGERERSKSSRELGEKSTKSLF